MKKIVLLMLACITAGGYAHAQNVFPATGRTGIYTTTPAVSLQVKGGARMGTLTNYINIDSATGNLSFLGTANYLVQNNQFAFRAATASNIGLYFNQTNSRIEFRNNSGTSVLNVGVGPTSGNVGIGTTAPAAKLEVAGNALINGVWIGRGNNSVGGNVALGTTLQNSTGDFNTALGDKNLLVNTTGESNTAVGFQSMITNTTGSQNTGVGESTLYPNTTGNYNTAIGSNAEGNNATGSGNTAVGVSGLITNISGSNNTALGYLADVTTSGLSNATAIGANAKVSASNSLVLGDNANVGIGISAPAAKLDVNGDALINGIKVGRGGGNISGNTVMGYQALQSNTTGGANTAFGRYALLNNSTGYSNVAIGENALRNNAITSNVVAVGDSALYNNGYGATEYWQGTGNTAIGSKTLFANTFGSYNTAIGFQALYSNDFSDGNVAVGNQALRSATGYGGIGGYNTAVGNYALLAMTTGKYNTGVGDYALIATTTGSDNTGIGELCLGYNVTGSSNTAMGDYSLSGGGTDHNYCTALGFFAGSFSQNSFTNSTAIGNGVALDASNKVRIGNTSVTSIGGQVGWTTFSDGRYKKNIKEDVKGLAFINSLKPVTYTVDVNGLNTYFHKNRIHDKKHDSTYDKMEKDLQPAADEASKIVYNGFIAQDVEAAAEKLNYNFSGVDKPKTKDGLYGLRYADFVVPLVKAVQELSTANSAKDQTIQSLQATVDKQQQQINAILQKLNDLQTAQQVCCNNAGSVQSSASQAITLNGSDIASLQQNVPNPYSNTTVINFSLPKQYKSAQIVITDISGQTIQQANVSGTNSLKIAAGSLASGNYKYSLIVDCKLISTKTMMIAK